MKRRLFSLLAPVAILALLAACKPEEPVQVEVQVPVTFQMESERLQTVKDRGKLICGVNSGVRGFGFLDEQGQFSGFDTDFCRALAVAIFNDVEAVEFRPLTTAERFTALQTNEIDVLIRNTTFTLGRDVELGTDFGPTTFYDGQGMMVREASGFTSLADMEGATVCVQSGTTTELNLADAFNTRGVSFDPLNFDTPEETYKAYDEGRCDGVTSDKSQLVGNRTGMADPAEHILLPETLSKEPLGPVWAHGDQQWGDVVRWVVYGIITAEEKGITSANVDDMVATPADDPEVKRMLGLEGDFGAKLGLVNDFVVNVIRAIGNYGEIYNRHLGPDGIDLPREGTLNELWITGGLLYAPPWR